MHTMNLNCIQIYFLILLFLEKNSFHINGMLRVLNKKEMEMRKDYWIVIGVSLPINVIVDIEVLCIYAHYISFAIYYF